MAKAKSPTPGKDLGMVEVVSGTGKVGDKAVLRQTKRGADFTSDGVKDNDLFLLPGSDYQIMIAVTMVAAAVRLFRLNQPTSVVFDEVQ